MVAISASVHSASASRVTAVPRVAANIFRDKFSALFFEQMVDLLQLLTGVPSFRIFPRDDVSLIPGIGANLLVELQPKFCVRDR
jgi:hypothetical protein